MIYLRFSLQTRKGAKMFKITCTVGNKEHLFYLEGPSNQDVEHVAMVLANNLSFDNGNTKPQLVSIEPVTQAGTPQFLYLGVEKSILEPKNEQSLRNEMLGQGIITGVIHHFGNNNTNPTTELYKFRVIKE